MKKVAVLASCLMFGMPAYAGADEPADAPEATYTVKRGDSLSKVAARELWRVLWYLNRDQIENPNLIEPGMVLRLPTVSGQANLVAEDRRTEAMTITYAREGAAKFNLPNGGVTPVVAGQKLMEFGTLVVSNGPLRLQLADNSVLTVAADTILDFSGVMVNPETGAANRTLRVKRGSVAFQLGRQPDASAQLHVVTPEATIQVASMYFSVAVEGGERSSVSVFDGRVAVNTNTQRLVVEQGYGALVPITDAPILRVALPQEPQMKSPTGITGRDVQFAWETVPGATDYEVIVARDAELNQVYFTGTVGAQPELKLELQNLGDYYWTVNAVNDKAFRSQPQTTRRFRVTKAAALHD